MAESEDMVHQTTYTVLEALPRREKIFWEIEGLSREELKALLQKGDPDYYCGASPEEKKEMSKYMVIIPYPSDRKVRYGLNNQGRLFHYFPVDTDVYEGSGSWQSDSTEKWRFVDRGFHQYLTRILTWLNQGKKRDGLIGTGGLFHVLQDQCGFFHSLEGEEGCSQWILDELLPKPPNCLATPTSLLKEECPEITLSEYRPRLLGTGVEEVCFHLYQRYRQVKSLNRKRLVPLVQACYRGDKLAEREIRRSIALSVAELTCDVITTIYCVATSHFSNSGLKQLARVSLTELKPINYPRHAAAPYRFNTLVRNYSLGPDGKKHPLALMLKTGGKMRERRFSEGIGLGTHRESVLTYAVPKRVFRKFHGYFGLHSSLGKEGQVELEVRFRGKREIKQLLNRNQPAVEINLTVTSGGLLEFITRSREGVRGINNNLVLAEPLLVK